MLNLADRLKQAEFKPIELEDADVFWNEHFLNVCEADAMLAHLIEQTHWIQPIIRLWGREVPSPRLAAWHGDRDAVYTYSGLKNEPRAWTPSLRNLRDRLKLATGVAFNSVLLNLYRDGSDSMGWHQDNEVELGPQPVIASVSVGDARRFVMKHVRKPNRRWEVRLTHRSALIMAGDSQSEWKHAVPKTSRDVGQRVNLTFRRIIV